MNSARELLALRKELLVARSSLQRLKIARDLGALHESLRWPHAAAVIAASPPARSVLFGLLLLLGGRGRFTRMLRGAAAILAVAKLAWLLTHGKDQPQPADAASPPAPQS